MRKICGNCENKNKIPDCKGCTWHDGLKYPTAYKGQKFRSTRKLRDEAPGKFDFEKKGDA